MLPGHPTAALEEFVRTLADGTRRWALVFGAGLSRGAGLPDWGGLVELAANAFGVARPPVLSAGNYPVLLQQCEASATSSDDFWNLVTGELCAPAEPSAAQQHVARTPFELFVSLNYDCLMEACLEEAGRKPPVLKYPNIDLTGLRDGSLLYLHGRCPDVGNRLTPLDVVLTQAGYDDAYSEGSDLLVALDVIFRSFDLIFLGTSLGDPDVAQVLRQVERRARRGPAQHGQQRMRLAFAATDMEHYVDGLDMAYDGLNLNIRPIWYYNPPGGRHSELENLLRYVAEAVR